MTYRNRFIVAAFVLTALLSLLAGCSSKSKFSVVGPAADFELQNVDGKTVKLADTAGKVRLFYFFWSHCPDVCLPTTNTMTHIQDELKDKGVFGTDTALVSITFDPKRDTLERLKEVATQYRADLSGWYFLRGEADFVQKLVGEYKVAFAKDKDDNFIHGNNFILVDRDNNIRKVYMIDEDLTYEQVAKDMIALTKE